MMIQLTSAPTDILRFINESVRYLRANSWPIFGLILVFYYIKTNGMCVTSVPCAGVAWARNETTTTIPPLEPKENHGYSVAGARAHCEGVWEGCYFHEQHERRLLLDRNVSCWSRRIRAIVIHHRSLTPRFLPPIPPCFHGEPLCTITIMPSSCDSD